MSTATSYESGLVIDWRSAIDSRDILFRVRLEADALWTLIKDSNAARRIYELLLGHFVDRSPLGKKAGAVQAVAGLVKSHYPMRLSSHER